MQRLRTRLGALLLLALLCAPLAEAAQKTRTFPGGAATDNILLASTVTPTQQMCIYIRFNPTSYDATTRRIYDWSDGTHLVSTIIVANGGVYSIVENQWSTSAGTWTIVSPSTGAEHDILRCYDAGATTNAPVIYLDGSSVTVTLATAPVGSFTALAQAITLGNRQDLTRSYPGTLSTFAIWTGTMLDATSATNLHNGMPPCLVSPANLIIYFPLDGGLSPEPELRAGNNGTVTATTVGTGPTAPYNPHCSTSTLMGVGR